MDASLLGIRNVSSSICRHRAISGGVSAIPSVCTSSAVVSCALAGRISMRNLYTKKVSFISGRETDGMISKRGLSFTRSSSSSNSNNETENSSIQEKRSFGNSRKDVLLIGLGVTLFGFGLESGLEFVGVDPLQAGNVVQLVLVLGLTIGWISTYIFRVSNKEMTYAQQLRDYEKQVMEKRLESLSEAELAALLEQVEEEKRQIASGEQIK